MIDEILQSFDVWDYFQKVWITHANLACNDFLSKFRIAKMKRLISDPENGFYQNSHAYFYYYSIALPTLRMTKW